LKAITPFRVVGGVVIALVVTFVILLKIETGDYLLTPDIAHPVAPLVHVADAKPAKGGGELYFVDVQEQKETELDHLFPWLHPHSARLPAQALIPPGSTDKAFVQAELREMATSQKIAAAVALRHAGYHVVVRPNGVRVDQIGLDTDAAGKLQPTDVIVAVNGKPTLTMDALQAVMAKVNPGETVTLRIRRGTTPLTKRIETYNSGGDARIGFLPAQSVEIGKLPLKIRIDSGNIGGPSAGLAFTLQVLRRLGEDVTHGYKVAATGTIGLDGSVGPIGGIEQKTWGVRDSGAQVFLVPKGGDNAREAMKFAGPNLKIIPVTSLEQALRALAGLHKPPNE